MFNTFFKKPKKPIECFVALQISEATIGAAVFTSENNKAKVLGVSFEKYDEGWQNLIEATDLAVSKAASEMNLSEIKKAVFGFHPSFLEGDKISKDKLPYLKKLTSELELSPSGFVVIPEAINFYFEEKEGGPQTSILAGVTKKELTVSLFRGGKLTDQAILARTEYINKDIEKALEKFTDVEIFPSKILLYDGGDLESVKEELLKYPWQSNSKFLHFPKIETLSADLCLQAIVEAAVSELNKTIESLEQKEVKEMPSSKVTPDIVQGTARVTPESLGFVKETDTVSQPQDSEQEDLTNKEEKKGFKLSLPKITLPWLSDKSQNHQVTKEEEAGFKNNTNAQRKFNLPIIKFPGSGKMRLFIIGLIGASMVLVGGYMFASYSLPKATLTLFVDPKVFDQEKEVSINPDILTSSSSTNEIPGKILEVQVSGTKTIPTTGKKIIGDPAKGSITIYNKTTSSRVFEKGTKISAKNLVFILDDNIEVPSATASGEEMYVNGKAKVNVTAAIIGPEGNLSSQTIFTVADFSNSSYSARNDQAFSGGTSREVNTASSRDQDSLLTQTTNELKEQAKKDLTAKLVNGEKLLEESLNGEIETRKFSHEADQETKELNLNLTMKYQGMIYQEKDFTTLMEKMLTLNIPDGYEFRPEETSLSVSEANISEKTVRFKATFTAKLFPKLDLEKIKKEISGMPVGKLESYIKTISNIIGYEVSFDTPFSFFKNNLPRSVKNITIEVKGR